MTTPFPAASPLALMTIGGVCARSHPSSKSSRPKVAVRGGGNPVALQEFLAVGLGALKLRGGAAGPEAGEARRFERIDHAERPAVLRDR